MSTPLDALSTILSNSQYVDLSPVIQSNMPGWSTHPSVTVIADARTHELHGYFTQALLMPEHTGSHVDAPAHVHSHLPDRTIDKYPLGKLIAPGKKLDARSLDLQPGELLTRSEFERLATEQGFGVQSGDIVLVEFGWDRYLEPDFLITPAARKWWGANEPGFSEDLCAWLADLGIRAVGTDTAACDSAVVDGVIYEEFGHITYFLPNDILILEGLTNLAALPSEFLFVALPLRILGGSGSPLRAIGIVPEKTQ
jgi:arylformamidase